MAASVVAAASCGGGQGEGEGPADGAAATGGLSGGATGGLAATGGVAATGGTKATGGSAGQQAMGGGGRSGSAGNPATGGEGARGGAASGGASMTMTGGRGGGAEGGRGASAGGTAGQGKPGGGSGGGAAGGGAGGATSSAITVWLAGDSTMANGSTPCPIGWGAKFQALFGKNATVVNSAVGGRSIRTWLYDVKTTMDASGECELGRDAQGQPTLQARWQNMLDNMKAGDYLLIQFGINDTSATCDRHVGTTAFATSLSMMADAAKARGTQAVFLTPVSSISCNSSNKAVGTRGAYSTATKTAATQSKVPVIDLEALSVALYNRLAFCPVPGGDVSASTTGPVGEFFCDDHTHFSATGAPQIAQLVADAIRSQGLGLAAYLK